MYMTSKRCLHGIDGMLEIIPIGNGSTICLSLGTTFVILVQGRICRRVGGRGVEPPLQLSTLPLLVSTPPSITSLYLIMYFASNFWATPHFEFHIPHGIENFNAAYICAIIVSASEKIIVLHVFYKTLGQWYSRVARYRLVNLWQNNIMSVIIWCLCLMAFTRSSTCR